MCNCVSVRSEQVRHCISQCCCPVKCKYAVHQRHRTVARGAAITSFFQRQLGTPDTHQTVLVWASICERGVQGTKDASVHNHSETFDVHVFTAPLHGAQEHFNHGPVRQIPVQRHGDINKHRLKKSAVDGRLREPGSFFVSRDSGAPDAPSHMLETSAGSFPQKASYTVEVSMMRGSAAA